MDYVLEEILKLTSDEKSLPFWEKAIEKLGKELVLEEVSETKYQLRTGNCNNPAKYLTALLMKKLKNIAEKGETIFPFKKTPYLNNANLTEIQERLKLPIPKEKTEGKLDKYISKQTIPWTSLIGSEFFTIRENKVLSDKVVFKLRTIENKKGIEIFLHRGKIEPSAQSYGILNAVHARILAALKILWADQQTTTKKGLDTYCYCDVGVSRIAKLMGYKNKIPGKRNTTWIYNTVFDLSVRPYYLDLTNLQLNGLKGFGFTLINEVFLIKQKNKSGQEENTLRVEFSLPVSKMLISGAFIAKDKEIIKCHGDIEFLLKLYLEPRLLSLKEEEVFHKKLSALIKKLNLPKADWHKYNSMRTRQFQKIISKIKNWKTATGMIIELEIKTGKEETLLEARLVKPKDIPILKISNKDEEKNK